MIAADWKRIADELDALGGAVLPRLIGARDAAQLRKLYAHDDAFRSTVDMGRHRFGEGEYRYFDYPLPRVVDDLRHALYPDLLRIARGWHDRLGRPSPWPDTLDEWLACCHARGQTKPTPLMLSYRAGGWNALHRDLYGDLVFPLQVVINLTEPEVDYIGGELLLLEQRPRAQSRGTALTLPFCHGVVFTTRDRPIESARGWSAAPVRHGVSVVRSGERVTLGIIFHDAA